MIELEKTKYEKKPWYPNLREGETYIWDRYLTAFPNAYDQVVYNLHIGEGAPIPEGTPENIARDFKLLTQYKIDVVGFIGSRVDIIEIKPYAGAGAIGQVLSYSELYKMYVDYTAKPNLVILTDQIRPDTETLAKQLNIKLVLI